MATNLQTLRAGMRLVTPTRNVVVLVKHTAGTWQCEYTRQSTMRGAVVFKASWLKTWCTVLPR